jgi:triacylglycerol lipase
MISPMCARRCILAIAAALVLPPVLPAQSSSLDWKEIDWTARLSNQAYYSDSALHVLFPGYSIWTQELPQVHGRIVLLTDHARGIQWIAPRGTWNAENVLLDVEFSHVRDRKLPVVLHHGFESVAIAAYDAVKPKLKRDYTLNFTGHSLGGAAALIMMAYLSADGYQIGHAVTYGQPKITDADGIKWFNRFRVRRVVDCHDPIPLTPPMKLFRYLDHPFRHFGEELILLDGPDVVLLPEHDAERMDVTAFWENFPRVNVKDHLMDNYIARIGPKLAGARHLPYVAGNRFSCGNTRPR